MRKARLFMALSALLGVFFVFPAYAQNWGGVATISTTMGVKANRLCVGEASRGDLGCPTYAPSLTTAGDVALTGGLTTSSISLTTAGTTWGYLGSAVSYIPNLGTNAISTTNISLTTINGQPLSSFGASATVVSGTTTMVTNFPDAILCTMGGQADVYVMTLSLAPYLGDGRYYYRAVVGGGTLQVGFNSSGAYGAFTSSDTNYTTAGNCATSISALYTAGRAFNFIGGSGSTGLGYAITSGTTSITVNSATGITSLTTAGTTWGYLSSGGSYLPTITTGSISTTTVQVSGTTATCSSTNAGTIRYTSVTTTLELCTGSSWQPIGVGIPAGTISAFASTTCPTGWSEYTAARGRFLRGIDNSAGNDPDGTRAPGATQADMVGPHNHQLTGNYIRGGAGTTANVTQGGGSFVYNASYDATANNTGAETRPKNVAVTYCQFNGTSNGWNNPLSGGSTVPGGSTGQIQYNTAGSFDASANLTFTNATQTLSTTNVSATNASASKVILNENGTEACTSSNYNALKVVNGTLYLCVNR